MKKIYKTYLRKYRACEEQVRLFQKLYPEGIHVCRDCFGDAQDQGLDVWWLVYLLGLESHALVHFHQKHTRLLETPGDILRLVDAWGLAFLERELLKIPSPTNMRTVNK
jgi:hypothetical protein